MCRNGRASLCRAHDAWPEASGRSHAVHAGLRLGPSRVRAAACYAVGPASDFHWLLDVGDLWMTMTVLEAQADMRRAYYSGATGILASALAWAASAATAFAHSPERAIWVLLGAGMLIYPVGLVLCRLLGASGAHVKGNPLGQLAGASTFWLIFCLPLAYGLGLSQPAWFFAAMLLIIGGRYLVFATLYGLRLYWALGLVLAAVGFGAAWLRASPAAIVVTGAATELMFAVAFLVLHRKDTSPNG